MTDTTTQPSILLNLIAAFLAPMFLGVTAGDVALARLAAMQTVNDYRAQNNADLIAVAQIIACGLAALGSLSLSMADDISLSMTLRLRGNAVALNRSAEQNRRALAKSNGPTPYQPAVPEYDIPSEAELFYAATTQAEQFPGPSTADEKRLQQMWAIAMVNEASELTASIPTLPPTEQKNASIRAAALGSTANHLLYGTPNLTEDPQNPTR